MPQTIYLGGRAIGISERCFVIAEACDNHLGDFEVAKEMVRQAKACGADAIKFQHHLPEEEMLRDNVPTSPNWEIPLYQFLEQCALKLDQHYELFRYCRELEIIYLCTPFSRRAASEINEMGVPAFKIGSGELTDLPTLKVIARFGKPMILSTGMSEWAEIDETVRTLRPINSQLMLMNCVSEYPARHADINLNVLGELQRRYDIIVGHSDHTPDIYTSIAAVALGAKLIEKHFILDRGQKGPDCCVSIEPFEFSELVKGVRRVEQALGSNKQIHDLEKPIRSWAHRSVVSLVPISRGSKIGPDMVWTKRPGTGIAAKHLEEVISRTVVCDIPANHLIRWEELE